MDKVLVHFGPRHCLIIGDDAEARAADWVNEQREMYGDEDVSFEPYRGAVADFRTSGRASPEQRPGESEP